MLPTSFLCTLIVPVFVSSPWSLPAVPDVADFAYPRIAATETELVRLRAAYRGSDETVRDVVMQRIREADFALQQPLVFPPRGGQHNQWYQCDTCQLALKTIDTTHHRCPQCEKIYSGEPYDDVMFSRIHSRNLKAMLAAAWAYSLTDDDKYGRFAGDVLLGYAARYLEYPYHSAGRGNGSWDKRAGGHLFEQTLTEAGAMASYIAPAYDLICAGDVLSDEQRQAIRDGLLRPMVESIARNRSGKSNWQTWHNAAMLSAGAVLGDKTWIERAIADPGNGFASQMETSVSDDGMWYENSWGYHFYTLNAMIRIVEYSRRLGVDLWSHPRLKSMFTVAIDYAMPDGRLPRFGDDVNTSIGSITQSLEFAFHAYGNQTMTSYLTQSATWDSIMLGRSVGQRSIRSELESRVFSSAGHAVVRGGGPKGLVSVITFGPYGGFHGHFDKLSFVFYGHGRELGVDPGRARSQAYRLPIHRNWYKATLSHNTVVVDGKSQAPASGRLLRFDSDPQGTLVVAQCDEAYDGVVHTRLLHQTSAYLLVFDDLKADAEHRFDWFYHNRGKLADCAVAEHPTTTPDADFAGTGYIANPRTGTSNDAIRVTCLDKNVANTLTLDAAAGTELLVGEGVGSSILDRVPLVRVTRRGKGTRFAAVLEPIIATESAHVRSVSWHEEDGRIRIEVDCDGHRDTIDVGEDYKDVTRTRHSLKS